MLANIKTSGMSWAVLFSSSQTLQFCGRQPTLPGGRLVGFCCDTRLTIALPSELNLAVKVNVC